MKYTLAESFVQAYFLSSVQNVRVRRYPSVFLPCTSVFIPSEEIHQCISVVKFLHQCFIQKERIHWWKEFTVYPKELYPIYDEIPDYSNSTSDIISLRLGFRRNLFLYLHPNLVSSPIKGILEILNLTPPLPPHPVHSDGYFGMDGLCQIKCK